jgi:geranylgeranyl diphosphate synthase, type I
VTTIDVMAEDRSAHEVLAWSRSLAEAALRTAVDTLPSSMRRFAAYHFGCGRWYRDRGGA